MSKTPWSIKGVDEATRQEMKKIAEETGLTLAELLTDLLSKKKIDLVKKNVKLTKPNINKIETKTKKSIKKDVTTKKTIEKKAKTFNNEKPVFEHLLTDRKGNSEISFSSITSDTMKEMVIEGRDLRDALRVHTKELERNISEKLNENLTSKLEIITEIIQSLNISNEYPSNTQENPYIGYDEINQKITNEIEHSHKKLKDDLCSIIEGKLSSGNANIIDEEKLNHLEILISKINIKIDKLDNITTPLNSDNGQIKLIHKEIEGFIKNIPNRLEGLLSDHNVNLSEINSSIQSLIYRVESLEKLANKANELSNYQEEEISQTINDYTPPHEEEEYKYPTIEEQQNEEISSLMSSYNQESIQETEETEKSSEASNNFHDFSEDDFATVPQMEAYQNKTSKNEDNIPEEYR